MEIIEVAAGLVFHEGKLLITQRPTGKPLEGLWEFPGGKREPRESFETCLRRELMEELGIEVEPRELVLRVRHEYPEKVVEIQFHECSWIGGELRARDGQNVKWVERDELAAYSFLAADEKLIGALLEEDEFWQ